MSEEKKEGKLSQEGQNGKVGREISKPPMQRRNIPKPPPLRDIPTLSQTTSIVQSAQAGKTETPSIQKTEGQKEKKSKDKKKVVFWSLLASGIGVIVIAVVLLLVFLLPKEEKYEIDLGANVSVSEGALTGTGSYKKGDSVTIVAEEIEGYRFTGWTLNGQEISDKNEYTFTIDETTEGEYTANYAKLYDITLASDNISVVIEGNKTQAIAGESISFTIPSNPDYRLLSVKVNDEILTAQDGKYTFTMPESDVEIVVESSKIYSVTLGEQSEYGKFNIEPMQATSGETITVNFELKEEYIYKHSLKRLYYIKAGQGEQITIENNAFIMPEGNVTVYAEFNNLFNINLTTNIEEEITLEGQGTYFEKDKVTITAPQVEGYRFRNWTYNGNPVTTEQEYIITSIDSSTSGTYIANYDKLYLISVNSSNGIVTIVGDKTNAIAKENVEFTVTPNPDYRLIEVKVNNETLQAQDGKYTFAMPNENATINVTYAELFDISVTSEHGQVEITDSKTQAIAGENVEFTVTPNPDYRLIEVKVNNKTLTEQDGKYTFAMPNENVEIIVTYNQEYAITVDSNSIEYIKIDKEKAIEGEEISFIVEEREGYRIDEVKYNETILTSENNSYTFSMPAENVSISVTYIQQFEVDLVCNIQLSGESQLSGEGIYDKGQSATITAPQVEGYRFKNWTLNGSVVSEESEYTIENIDSTTSGTYIANYDKLYNITINSSHGTVTIVGDKTQAIAGESVEFTVTPNLDYRLIDVKLNGQVLQAQDGKYTFVMPNKNVEIIVTYNQEYSITVDSSATEMIANLSSVSAVENERLTFLSLAPATITDTEITIQEFKVTSEEGEELSLIQSAEEYSFVMPASNVTISAGTKPTYRRLDDFEFSENSVIGYNKDSEIIKIPAYYDKITINSQDYIIERESETSLYVLDIGNNAFEGNTNITRVSLHDSLQSIGEAAFKDCVNLKEVSFAVPTYGGGDEIISGESQIETIADQAFYNCAKLYLLESFSGTKLKTIGSQAFYNCESLVDIILPSTLQTINNGAFELCTNLAIVINESNLINIDKGQTSNGHVGYYAYRAVNKSTSPNVDIIEDWADGGVKYYQDGDLGEVIAIGPLYPDTDRVVLYSTTTEILSKAFNKCLTLEKIGYPGTIDQWASIKFGEEWALKFDGDEILDNGLTLQTREGVAKDITITVESISNYAFQGITSIETVLIGDGVLSIGDFAFSHNLNLIKVYCENFGNNSRLTLIGDAAFGYCGSSQEMGLGERSIMIAGLGAYDYVDDGVSRHMFEGTLVDELIIANPLVCAWSDEGLEHLRSYVSTRVKVNQRALEVSGSSSQFWDNFTESEGLYLVWN